MGRTFVVDREAVAPLLGSLIAAMIVAAAMSTVLLQTANDSAPGARAAQTRVLVGAGSLADVLLSSPGVGWYGGQPCVADQLNESGFDPDGVGRLGLAPETCDVRAGASPGSMSFEKLVDLQRAGYARDDSNDHLDYEEARDALGLTELGLDFHLRTFPVLPVLAHVLETEQPDETLRIAYVGDYVPPPEFYAIEHSSGVSDEPSQAVFWVNVTNEGVTSTLVDVNYTLHLGNQDIALFEQTPLVPPDGYANLTVEVPKSLDWLWSDPVVDYALADPVHAVGSGTIDTAGIDMTSLFLVQVFNVNPEEVQYVLDNGSATQRIHYASYDGLGTPVPYIGWTLEIYDALDVLVASDTLLDARGWEDFDLASAGEYRVELKDILGGIVAQDTIVVVSDPVGGYSPTGAGSGIPPAPSTVAEAAYLAPLAGGFDPFTYSADYDHPLLPYQAGGDVYPDLAAVLENDLPSMLVDDNGTNATNDDTGRLDDYNVLIIGSGVDHSALAMPSAEAAIRDWVLAGGLLTVFGSDDQSTQWLGPLFEVAIEAGSGGLMAPDQGHPVLNSPNEIDILALAEPATIWEFASQADADHFDHVLVEDDGDALSLSHHGEFGYGRIVLSAFRPYDVLDGNATECDVEQLSADCLGLALIHNLVTQRYAGIFVDFGPPIDQRRADGSSTRVASVWQPVLERDVPLLVVVHVN